LLTSAADLRAAGASWLKVGEHTKRSPETCRQWPRRFPDTWRRLYREAEKHLIDEAAAEARVILRQMLRSPDQKIVLAAAQILIRGRDQQRALEERAERPDPAAVAAEITEFARYLKGLTDAQLAAHLDAFLARRQLAAAGTAAGTDDPASPGKPQ
jgi:hypothetical protein